MNDLFVNMASSLHDSTRLVQPRLPFLFETPVRRRSNLLAVQTNADTLETHEFLEAPAPVNARQDRHSAEESAPAVRFRESASTAADRVATPFSSSSLSVERKRDQLGEPETRRRRAAESATTSEAVRSTPRFPRPRGDFKKVREAADAPIERPAIPRRAAAEPANIATQAPAFAIAPASQRERRLPNEEPVKPAPLAIEPRIAAPQPQSFVPSPAARTHTAAEISRRRQIAKPAETTVNVSIGRIEVRAVPTRTERRSKQEKPQVMPLDEYLRSRAEHRRL